MARVRNVVSVFGCACVVGAGALWEQGLRDAGGKYRFGEEITIAELRADATKAPGRFLVRSSGVQMKFRPAVSTENGTKSLLQLKDETRTFLFEAAAEGGCESIATPENLFRLWGTDRGVAALADSWSDSLRGKHPTAVPLRPESGVPSRVEAAALFRHGDEAALWAVTVGEGGRFVLHAAYGLSLTGCTATPPGGDCSCTASGPGADCEAWTDAITGTGHVRCAEAGRTSNCTSRGGKCRCHVQ